MENQRDRRTALEDLWLERLHDAKARLDLARKRTNEIQRDLGAGLMPPSDGRYFYSKVVRTENLALAQYRRVLYIYTDLVVHGVIPDETEGAH